MGLGGDAVDGVRNDALPYGVDTIVLRVSWPAPVRAPLTGRMWRMRPLRGRRLEAESSVGIGDGGGSFSDNGITQVTPVQFVAPRGFPIPPVAIPGSPENEAFAKRGVEGFSALGRAIDRLLRAEETDKEPKLRDMKKLSEGEAAALAAGGHHPHDLKHGYGDSMADLYKDKDGNIYIGSKKGTDEATDAHLNIRDFSK